MSVVLLILKIIGILLLAVLGLLLLLILSLLLAPVRYRIRGSSEPELALGASFSWLFPLVRFFVGYEGKSLIQRLWILGIPISLERKGKRAKGPKKPRRKKSGRAGEKSVNPPGEPQEEEPQAAFGADRTEGEPGIMAEPEEDGPGAEDAPPSPEKASGLRKVLAKLSGIFQKVRSLRCMIKEKVAKLKEIALRIWQEIRDEANRRVLKLVLGEGKALLGHYLPRKLRADLQFGMADPSVTGQLLGLFSLFPLFLRPGVSIRPDFMAEKMYFTGSFEMKGRVRTVHLVASAIRLWRDQDVKKLIQRVRNRR